MGNARWVIPVMAGMVMTPIAIGLGFLLISSVNDGEDPDLGAPAPMSTELKAGDGGVPPEYGQLILDAAADCDQKLPATVLAAQLKQGSNFQPRAQSIESGDRPPAQGIAQFRPADWEAEGYDANKDGKADVWDPADAIPSQGRAMCKLLTKAKERPELRGKPIEVALAAYHAGWDTVETYKGVPRASWADGATYEYVKGVVKSAAYMIVPAGGSLPGSWTLPVGGPAGAPYHQQGSSWSTGLHTGIDFIVPTGTEVKAIGPGTIATAGPGGDYGNQIVVRHDDGTYSQYAHLSEIRVVAGQRVEGSTVIGLSGATGNVTGPHLHFEIRTGPAFGSDISPLPYLRAKGLIS
ncbi:peptidoglycan DD-metalloendopeptidase family protein [Streptomyces sp. NPDC059096]|uniref:peptidoglycan DD-metalloendopeptidase family protein n=1 Tax=unclassified Streptomyces TaxID=2593676 RepID=UPI003687D3B5